MAPLAGPLRAAGYDVLNWGYPSHGHTIEALGARLEQRLRAARLPAGTRVHFVGHSLGGIVVRSLLARDDLPFAPGRVVMLAPPNQGSDVAERMAPLLGWWLTPLPQLRPAAMRDAPALPPAVEVGVIAGRYDAKVAVPRTHLAGERAHVVVPATHTFLMHRADVRRLVLRYLRAGTFADGDAAAR